MTDKGGTTSAAGEMAAADSMAAVMATRDWTGTAVGDPAGWPALLQTLIQLILTSRFPMWLGWGPDLAFFYNDAYARDTLGAKHPWALGRPAREVWSEIWHDISPRVDAVMSSGQATWDEDLMLFVERSGYKEESFHTFSYSPVSDADGTVVGLLCVVAEETRRVIGERRMETLRELASDLSGARTEEAVLEAVGRRLGANTRDLPLTLTYILDPDGSARLACATGVEPGSAGAAQVIRPDDDDPPWPVIAVARTGATRVVSHLDRSGPLQFGAAWPDPPTQAVLVPLSDGVQPAPVGVFVAGLSPYRRLDPEYQGFAELVAAAIGPGLAGARAYDSERRRAEALAELDRAKTEFFSNVSHEFRTPLTLIAAPADDALRDDLHPLPGPQRARMEVIRRNARRLRRLVNDMLDFARIEGGRLQAETEETDLVQLTREVALSFAPAIERAGLRFALELEPLGGPVHIDRDMWEKILLNLLSNALKFTLEGSVTVTLRPEGEDVVLTVADTGAGIAASDIGHLFERFYRAPRPAARSHEGTGIGLALVSELARLHSGDVSVKSVEGRGAEFQVRVPFGVPDGSGGPAQRESSLPAYLEEAYQWLAGETGVVPPLPVLDAVTGGTAESTVLVVDDNPDMRGYLERLLTPFWKVLVAADGRDALEQARLSTPDLVLTDVMMPRLDGFGLLQALRADPVTATVPVVFLSARAGEEAAVEGLEAGADDYLVKPFSGLELLARVRSNLELAALRNRDAQWRAALVDSLQDAVVVIDASGDVIEANAAFEQILGWPRSGLPYRPPFPWMTDGTGPDGEDDSFALHERIFAGERLSAIVTLRHRLGHRLQVAVTANSVGEGAGRRVVCAFHDVTAEMARTGRDAALARLGTRLAEASDGREVRTAGLDELRRAFGARRAALLVGGADGTVAQEEHSSGDGPSLPAERLSGVMRGLARNNPLPVAAGPGGATLSGMAALIDPRDDRQAVWLEFAEPRPVSADERSLFAVLCGYFGQARRRAQLFDDNRTVATAMQRAILGPTAVPAGMAVRYLPAVQPLEVGGDWYDVVELGGDRMAVVVGDCTGRGLDAATTMGQLRSACRALLLQVAAPADALAALDQFAERLPGALCTTVFCAVIDRSGSSMRYSSAGHLPGVLVAADGTTTVMDGGRGVPLGLAADRRRPEAEVDLPPGSSLVLYTDGLIERRRESLEVGIARLAGAVQWHRHLGPDELADRLLSGLVPSSGHGDDIALVVHRQPVGSADGRQGASGPEETGGYRLEMRAAPDDLADMRRSLRGWMSGAGIDDRDADDLTIAVGEACANCIEHAYRFSADGRVGIEARTDGDEVRITVSDCGAWREPGPAADRGRGLAIMSALVESVEVTPSTEGTVVCLRKRVMR